MSRQEGELKNSAAGNRPTFMVASLAKKFTTEGGMEQFVEFDMGAKLRDSLECLLLSPWEARKNSKLLLAHIIVNTLQTKGDTICVRIANPTHTRIHLNKRHKTVRSGAG